MRIAVLLSTYNGERYLEEQIDSILEQDIEEQFELIVRDDGSTDSTISILQAYAETGRLKYMVGDNIGAARSFVELLNLTPGYDYYAFSDQDDVWHRNKLRRAIQSIKDVQGPALYCSNTSLVDSCLNPLGRNAHRKLPTYNLISVLCLASCAQGCTSVINGELAAIIQSNDIPNTFVMHDSLITSLCCLIDGTIIYDDEPTMMYRMHGSNVFGLVTAKQSVLKVIKRRILEIISKNQITMADQAESLLHTYNEVIPPANKSMCKLVISTRNSILSRIAIVMNMRLKHDTINMTITKKLSILIGSN